VPEAWSAKPVNVREKVIMVKKIEKGLELIDAAEKG